MEFSISLWVQKIIKAGAKALIAAALAFFAAHHVDLSKAGVNVDPEVLAGSLTVVGVAALEGIRNYLKTKLKLRWL